MAKLFEEFAKGFGDAVADIREKLVEEPMYGRTVTERDSAAPQWPEATNSQPFGSLEQTREIEQDRDIER